MSSIVVGVDGSDTSRRALRWAFDEAKLRGATVVAVHAWRHPIPVGTIEGVVATMPDIDFAKEAEELVDREIREVGGEDPGVNVKKVAVEQPAASALLDAAKSADLLVMGSRGLGGFRGLLLGSVGQQCAQHSPCPVVIVPDQARVDGA